MHETQLLTSPSSSIPTINKSLIQEVVLKLVLEKISVFLRSIRTRSFLFCSIIALMIKFVGFNAPTADILKFDVFAIDLWMPLFALSFISISSISRFIDRMVSWLFLTVLGLEFFSTFLTLYIASGWIIVPVEFCIIHSQIPRTVTELGNNLKTPDTSCGASLVKMAGVPFVFIEFSATVVLIVIAISLFRWNSMQNRNNATQME